MPWKFEKRGYFSVKSAYRVACAFSVGNIFASSSSGDPYGPLWKALWRAKVPSKVAIFGWRAAHNLLPSRAALSSKGYTGPLQCVICSSDVETLEHLFCDCSFVREIVGGPPFSIPRSTLRWKEWLLTRAISLAPASFDQLLVLLWSVWKHRNDTLWRGRTRTSAQLVATAMAWYEEFLQANQVTVNPQQDQSRPQKKWCPPADGMLKLNVDGAFFPSIQYGGTGGMLRNSQGQFIAAFSCRMEFVSSPLHIELLALRNGLELLSTLQITKAVVESDCLLAVQALNSVAADLSPLSALVSDLKTFLAENREVTICFVPRQGNVIAHRLASYSYESNVHCNWFANAPDFILDALLYDVNRI